MFPQLDPTDAEYLARLIVSIAGVLLFFTLAVWMIRRKQKKDSTVSVSAPISEESDSVAFSDNHVENTERSLTLQQGYQTWKAERLLQSEDGRSLFLRAGVEKSGLRYQLVATSQVQTFAILLSILMAEHDAQASTQAEALFASLLAHPAYGQSDLSSWHYMPDLPRSPQLDADLHSEAWLIFALQIATRRWTELKRFHYAEIIPARMLALHNYLEDMDPDALSHLPFSGYLATRLRTMEPKLDWSALDKNLEIQFPQFETQDTIETGQDLSRLAFSLLQEGLLAWLDQDADALREIRQAEPSLRQLVEEYSQRSITETNFSRTAMLAMSVPAILTLQVTELNIRVWEELVSSQPDKNDGLGATLRLLGLAFLENHQF